LADSAPQEQLRSRELGVELELECGVVRRASRDMTQLGTSLRSTTDIAQADDPISPQQRQRVTAKLAFRGRRIRLEPIRQLGSARSGADPYTAGSNGPRKRTCGSNTSCRSLGSSSAGQYQVDAVDPRRRLTAAGAAAARATG